MNPLSFRARLALVMGALILLISAVIWIYVPRKLEEEAITLIAHKAETLAHLTAFTIHPALYFKDRGALQEALMGTRQDKDVAYVVVAGPTGDRLSVFHPERASSKALSRTAPGGGLSPDGSLYEVMTPVRDGNRQLARLYLGISLERVRREIGKTRVAIGLLGGGILALGVIAIVLISDLLTRPLRQVAAGAQRIAAGDLGHRVPSGRGDEIGRLAGSFNDMAEKVSARDASLRQLSRRLLSVQEQERVRIAREVHDELGQALTALKIDVSRDQPASDLSQTIDKIVDLVRRIATDLRPAILDDLGVTAALEQQLRRLRERTGIATTLNVPEDPQLDMLTSVTVYRIVQESIANVVRHADASRVDVSLIITGRTVVLEIRDNGRGITREEIASWQSLGLLGIRERAELLGGSVGIEGRPGEGTLLSVTLPTIEDDRNASRSVR